MSHDDSCRILTRRWLPLAAFLLFLSSVLGFAVAQAEPWPDFFSRWKFKVQKSAGAEMTDIFWAHLHAGDTGFESFTLFPSIRDAQAANSVIDPSAIPAGNQVRYTAHGVPISGWLDAPWVFVVNPDNAGLATLLDGIHDLSLEVQGPNKMDIRPHPMYLHLHRGVAIDPRVPIIARNHTTDYDDYGPTTSPGVVYVDRSERLPVGYPVDPSVTPWHTPPQGTDLYQEEMAPHSDLFMPVQMWWEEPLGTVNGGLSFIRGMGSKFATEHGTELYDQVEGDRDVNKFGLGGHRNFPFRDGPRGIGWSSPWVTGQVDSTGGLAFVETGGPLRYMYPNGELITVAGWRVKPGKDPVWMLKPLTTIRTNMELRGTWVNGVRTEPADRGFHYATDVAIDPLNENIWYVAGFGDNVIWKVEIEDRVNWNATVSVFAGSVIHYPGYVDEQGINARFNGPSSIVFDPICDCMYVADQTNDAIRKITRNKVVTTVLGSPGMGQRLSTRGLPTGIGQCMDVQPFPMECYNEKLNPTVAKIEVTAAEAATGIKPEPYKPMTVRVDSTGRLVILELGYALIHRYDPVTGVTKYLGELEGRFDRWMIGWMWLDVDRWGNSGPLDSIYFLQGVAASMPPLPPGGSNYNEVFGWLPAEGGTPQWLSGPDIQSTPDGWGKIAETDLPHYPWMVAIDPRGALYLSGMGEHGITRVRMRKSADPHPVDLAAYDRGAGLWLAGEPIGGYSQSFKFGHGGHNLLGFADTWGLVGNVTDAELITIFEIPASIQATPTRLADLLSFIRINRGNQLAQPVTSCLMSITTCPTYPTYIGDIYDTYDGAGTNQARCMLRASDFYNWCATNVSVRARYYSDATMVEANSYPNVDPVGYIEAANCDYIWGWTYDPDTPSESIVVHLYDGPGFGTIINGYPANLSRPDVNSALGITGNHGYTIPTPVQFKTGTAHTIYVYGINSDTWGGGNPALGNSGMSLNCPVP